MASTRGWRRPPSEARLRSALRDVFPPAADESLELHMRSVAVPPPHRHGLAIAGPFVVKFAWSRSASRLLQHQARVLIALAELTQRWAVPVPVPLATAAEPALLVYRRLRGRPLDWTARSTPHAAAIRATGEQIGTLLSQLHAPSLLNGLETAGLRLPDPMPQSTPDALRTRMFHLLDRHRRNLAEPLVETVEQLLGLPAPRAFLHGDLHGYNLLVSDDVTHVVGLVDFEGAAVGDPAFDLRYLPAILPNLSLLRPVLDAYGNAGGAPLDLRRALAWHVLTDLGDALWRTEQGVEVVDGPLSRRFDDLLVRLEAAGF